MYTTSRPASSIFPEFLWHSCMTTSIRASTSRNCTVTSTEENWTFYKGYNIEKRSSMIKVLFHWMVQYVFFISQETVLILNIYTCNKFYNLCSLTIHSAYCSWNLNKTSTWTWKSLSLSLSLSLSMYMYLFLIQGTWVHW